MTEPVRPPYDNATLRAPRNTKPHIALRDGWWRVSPRPRWIVEGRGWSLAHSFVIQRNRPAARLSCRCALPDAG